MRVAVGGMPAHLLGLESVCEDQLVRSTLSHEQLLYADPGEC